MPTTSSSCTQKSRCRVATIRAQGIHPILKIETDQGVYGLGEVRDGLHPDTAMRLKPLLIGQNPCNVENLFRRIKRYGAESREAGGGCAVEIAHVLHLPGSPVR